MDPLTLMAILSGVGAISAPLIDKFFPGNKEQNQQFPTMNQGQQDLFSQLSGGMGGANSQMMQNLQGLLSNSPKAFEAFEAPYKAQFQQETIPELMQQLTNVGGLRSSALGQQMGQAGAGLSQQLAALRGQLQQGAMQQLQGMNSNMLGQRTFKNAYKPGTPGLGTSMAPGLAQASANFGMASGMRNNNMNNPQYGQNTGMAQQGPGGYTTYGKYNPYTDMTS